MNFKMYLTGKTYLKSIFIAFIIITNYPEIGALTFSDVQIKEQEDTVKKVMYAMLAMQRRAWEQGVASQALLELGEKDLVILMAKDAVVNQKKKAILKLLSAAPVE